MSNCPICHKETNLIEESTASYNLLRCSNCDLVFSSSFSGRSLADIYDQEYQSGQYRKKYEQAREAAEGKHTHLYYGERIFFRRNHKRGERLLDVGCGAGTFLVKAQRKSYKVHGIEISEEAVTFAENELGLNVDLGGVQDVLKCKPYYKDFFDVCTSFEVIEHVNEPLKFLASIKTALKPRGEIYLSTPNWNSQYYQCARGHLSRPPIHTLFFNPSSIKKILKKVGFEKIKVYEKPFAVGEFANVESVIKRFCLIGYSAIFDGIFQRTPGITMVVRARKPE